MSDNVYTVNDQGHNMSAATLERYTRLLILAEAARAVSDLEEYRRIKDMAKELRKSSQLT